MNQKAVDWIFRLVVTPIFGLLAIVGMVWLFDIMFLGGALTQAVIWGAVWPWLRS